MDKITIDRINLMHPKLRDELLADYKIVNNQLPKYVRLRLSHTHRTPEEQHKLFLQRPKVTNADSWQSIHNYGLAFDIVILFDKDKNGTFETASWANDVHWVKVVNYLKNKGWSWGGDFKSFKDTPHFEKTYGFNWKVLKQRIDKGIVIVDNGITYPKI